MNAAAPLSILRRWDVILLLVAGGLTFSAGLMLIGGLLGLGFSPLHFENPVSNGMYGLGLIVAGLTTLWVARRAVKAVQEQDRAAERESIEAIRRVAFGDGNGHGGA